MTCSCTARSLKYRSVKTTAKNGAVNVPDTICDTKPLSQSASGERIRLRTIWKTTRSRIVSTSRNWARKRRQAGTGGADGTVRVWDLATGTPVSDPFTGHDGPVNAVAIEATEVAATQKRGTLVPVRPPEPIRGPR